MTLVVCAVVFTRRLVVYAAAAVFRQGRIRLLLLVPLLPLPFVHSWGFVVRGQLLPNPLSFALIPGAMGLLVAMVQQCRGRGSRAPGLLFHLSSALL